MSDLPAQQKHRLCAEAGLNSKEKNRFYLVGIEQRKAKDEMYWAPLWDRCRSYGVNLGFEPEFRSWIAVLNV